MEVIWNVPETRRQGGSQAPLRRMQCSALRATRHPARVPRLLSLNVSFAHRGGQLRCFRVVDRVRQGVFKMQIPGSPLGDANSAGGARDRNQLILGWVGVQGPLVEKF